MMGGTNMLSNVLDLVFSLVTALLSTLPASFVRQYLEQVEALDVLSSVNYFIPFNLMLKISQGWLACCASYLIYHYVMMVYKESRKN